MAKPQNQGPKNGPVGSGTRITRVKNTVTTTQMTTAEKVRIFLFGVFELLAWQKKFKVKK